MDSGIRKEKRESGASPERTRHCNRERSTKPLGAVLRRCVSFDLKSGDLPEFREPLNKSSLAEQRIF